VVRIAGVSDRNRYFYLDRFESYWRQTRWHSGFTVRSSVSGLEMSFYTLPLNRSGSSGSVSLFLVCSCCLYPQLLIHKAWTNLLPALLNSFFAGHSLQPSKTSTNHYRPGPSELPCVVCDNLSRLFKRIIKR